MKRISSRMCTSTTLAAAVAAILSSPGVVMAQSANATLQGSAPANAEVVAKNKDTGYTRTTHADADGTYVIPGLPPGRYSVHAGTGTPNDVTLSVASTATLNLDTLEAVTVNGKRLVEVRTPEIGAVISLNEIQTVPQLTRNFLEFADSVPGVIFNVGTNGAVTFRSGASTPDSANIFIDGVGQKGYVRSGQAGQSDGSQGNPFPQLAIQEYKVITSNYKAEYDQLSSAAISAVTKSGTNEFHGEVLGTYSSDRFRDATPGEAAQTPPMKVPSQDREFAGAFGGPIIEDKAHFFVTYEGKRYSQPVTVTYANSPTPPSAVISALPQSVSSQVGPANIVFDENLYFAKLDYEFSDKDRLVLDSKIRRESSSGNGAGVGQAVSATLDTKNTDTRVTFRWEHTADHWYNEAVLAHEDAFFTPQFQNVTANGSDYPFQTSSVDANGNVNYADHGILNTGAADPRGTQNKGQKGISFQDDITFPKVNWGHGEHDIKAGIKYKLVDLTAMDSCALCYPVFTYNVGPGGVESTPYQATFSANTSLASSVAKSSDRQLGVYFQDDWKFDKHLTLNLGIRWDAEWNPNYLNWKTPTSIANLFNEVSPYGGQTWAQLYASGPYGYNVNDYLGNGSNRKANLGEFQPRLGFSYDINGDQKYVIVGGAGRSYDRDLFDYLQLEQVKLAASPVNLQFATASHPGGLAWSDSYLNGPAGLQSLVSGTVGDVFLTNNKLKTPYSDQFSLGIHAQLADWNTSATVSRINAHDGFTFLVGARGAGGAYFVPQPWSQATTPWDATPGTYTPLGMTGNLILSSNGVETRTTQVLLSAQKPFTLESGWGMTIAYTFTDAKSNSYTGDSTGFTQNEFSANWPNMATAPFIQSNFAPRHRVVMTGTLALPWDMVLGGKLTLATPLPNAYDGNCTNGVTYPWGTNCTQTSFLPKDALGYRSLDVQLTKNIKIMDFASAYVRLDVLNLLNNQNYTDYNTYGGPNGSVGGVTYNTTGNISGSPMTLRLTVGGKF